MMMYELFNDDAKKPKEPDFLDELLAHKAAAQGVNMTLPKQEYNYHYCPHCEGLNAFSVIVTKKEIVYVCDWCQGEFKNEC